MHTQFDINISLEKSSKPSNTYEKYYAPVQVETGDMWNAFYVQQVVCRNISYIVCVMIAINALFVSIT